jgi:aspartate/methionine/tyrosine aminotransferase
MTDVSDRLAPETHAPSPRELMTSLRPEALAAPESGIVEVFNYGRDRQGLIPLWAGEGDLPTPSFISDAASQALADGHTFYTNNRGIPALRQAIAAYMSRLYGIPADMERYFVTIGGMHALQTAVRMIAGHGDEVLVPTPAWPNFGGALTVAGAVPVEVPMTVQPGRGWTLDIDDLAAAITPRTRAVVINSPANPTGWTATRDELAAILALARRHGLWIIADEIYGRYVFDGSPRAASFHDVMEETDRVMFVQTFSKNWAMTGWRIGWLECHPSLGQTFENLMQYSCSGVAPFQQRAAIAAIEQGEPFIAEQIARAREGRDIFCRGLEATGRAVFTVPVGALYVFFSIAGEEDTRRLALRLVDEANVGLAPGTAFGAAGAGYMRACTFRRSDDLHEAVRRLQRVLGR